MPNKLPPQITDVKVGDTIEFIRRTYDGVLYLAGSNGVKARVVATSRYKTSAILAFYNPRRNIHKQVTREGMFSYKGFKYCRIVSMALIQQNCRKVGGKA